MYVNVHSYLYGLVYMCKSVVLYTFISTDVIYAKTYVECVHRMLALTHCLHIVIVHPCDSICRTIEGHYVTRAACSHVTRTGWTALGAVAQFNPLQWVEVGR